jgi:Amt family ammonium transporter
MTFAMITPALIVGAFAERMKFSALVLFTVLWLTLIYFRWPTWSGTGAGRMRSATPQRPWWMRRRRQQGDGADGARQVTADAGLLSNGAPSTSRAAPWCTSSRACRDSSARAARKRIGYGRDLIAPHSLTMTMIGASLLWVGWFGFNAGSNLEANGTDRPCDDQHLRGHRAAGLSWLFVEWGAKGKPSLLGLLSGAIAGLVAVTPASGFAGPMGSIVLGPRAGRRVLRVLLLGEERARLRRLPRRVRHPLRRRHPGRHRHRDPGLPGARRRGIPDYTPTRAASPRPTTCSARPCGRRSKRCCSRSPGPGIGSAILFKLVDLIVGLRVTHEEEREGLDLADHGERAYNY